MQNSLPVKVGANEIRGRISTDFGSVLSIIRNQVKPAFVIFFLLTLITGIFYPLLITGIAQAVFPVQANGNLIVHEGTVVGSALIGQPYTSPGYFWGRPSATSPVPYNAGLVRIESGPRTLH
jgi:K+-transporting ATPase KdpC subunit